MNSFFYGSLSVLFLVAIQVFFLHPSHKESGIQLSEPSAIDSARSCRSLHLHLTETSSFVLDGVPVPRARLRQALAPAVHYSLTISAHEHSSNGALVAALDAAQSLGIEGVMVVSEIVQ